jgi:site-specific DNA-methyltransferase (adenine-specific)
MSLLKTTGTSSSSTGAEIGEEEDAHRLDWYPGPDDDPEGMPVEAVDAWVTSGGAESLRSIAKRLESATWHPSVELAGSLVRAAALALAQANGKPAQITDIRKGLLAAEHLFRLRGSKLIESNLIVAQRIRTEWELGRMLRGTVKHPGGGVAGKHRSPDVTGGLRLRDLGVSKNQSSLFQKVASIDFDDLEHWISGVVNDPDVELATTLALDVLWREQKRERTTAARVAVAEAVLPAGVVLAVADARALPLGDEVVDLTFTSPPYGLDIRYEGGDVVAADWPAFMCHWMGEALRVTKPHGRLAVNVPLDTSRPCPRPTYAETIVAGIRAGWRYQFTIAWDEGNTSKGNRSLGSVNSSARPYHVSPAEMIAVFSNGEWAPSCEGADDILPDDWQSWGREVWRIPGESNPWEGHPAPFPEALARRVIQYLSPIGATALDPFCGSGTTVAVASRLGRAALGFDVSEEYVESAKRRAAQ